MDMCACFKDQSTSAQYTFFIFRTLYKIYLTTMYVYIVFIQQYQKFQNNCQIVWK